MISGKMHSLFKKRNYGYGHKEKVGKNVSFNKSYPPRTETPFLYPAAITMPLITRHLFYVRANNACFSALEP